ncbi:DUF2126 domain-containing protein [Acidisphaera sp. L21]|uniref:transglutaminase family protein n=1 Tax=Acidisphaera sp. L21 TaxID=1641851 RepID=UPI00131B0E61|nr:transglutaminase family protein [Acidisphaera sp. L21]
MALHVALTHRTSYHYDRPVQLGPQTIRLRPAPHSRTPILSYSLGIEPAGHFINWQQDPQGNFLARVVFPERVTEFVVTVDLLADMATINPFDFFLETDAETVPFTYEPVLKTELAAFLRIEPPGPLLAGLLETLRPAGERTIDFLVRVNQAVRDRIGYIVRMEPGVWSPEQTLGEAQGSCRDSAWVLVQAFRNLGYAARFVSGYLIQLKPDIVSVEGPAGASEDFTDLHAWAEVYLPGAGWVGLDATSGLLTGEGHIPLAATPEPLSAAPISGMVEPAETTFGFEMKLTRVVETPRVTKPYAPEQWAAIKAAGDRVDTALEAGDVRLTMGGEPTFVSDKDPDGAEWTIDALGPTKRREAGQLIRRLMVLWSTGAALQYGAGKHYPGEQTPRWALHATWRRDGEPIWTNPALLIDPDTTPTGAATAETAAAFARGLADTLGVPAACAMAAYEDQPYFLMREGRLPANVVAEASQARDPQERARLLRVFSQGLDAVAGYVMPLKRFGTGAARRWQSELWEMREGKIFLVQGDSSMGVRLPLASLPYVDPKELEEEPEPDPMAATVPFPPHAALPGPGQPTSARGVRTALTVQARDGLLFIYIPPLPNAEDWLSLVAGIERTAAALHQGVVLEGYKAPYDRRMDAFSVTPDPGVIEVNVHPATNWPEIVEHTEQLYEQARQCGLRAEKFMLDGRHVGTGGGNHVVMGAATPEDSPFLRRPDLLRSLLGFWHNHPSLSFLFSGLFIGPMSQHPRIDEARQDAVRELEIAFAQLKREGTTPPWITDRLFRNILVDMTGNTHRTEFCIDKMYSPDSSSGRLGLVEFRAFEMPPHAEMAAAQTLLMRTAVAAFWQVPYERRLIRWGTRIHDDFMLPHYVWQDFRDAMEELTVHGAGFGASMDPAWFAPHLAFRFPVIGTVAVHDMTLELRHALEPWHAMGETPGGGGTVRYVDSSVERMQARVTGWEPERFALTCNGVAVPMRSTGIAGEFVAGVRFKAWQPWSALHPTIAAQSPLVFDVYDRWNGRSLGGLTHHVTHPGGRSYDRFPVNANEAEARRRSRFLPFGHTPGPMEPPVGDASAELPRTLDLRAYA